MPPIELPQRTHVVLAIQYRYPDWSPGRWEDQRTTVQRTDTGDLDHLESALDTQYANLRAYREACPDQEWRLILRDERTLG